MGQKFWIDRRDHLPVGFRGGLQFAPYREFAPPPASASAAMIFICSVIEKHVGRVDELLAVHKHIEAEETIERYDRAALDCSPEFERHRRHQSAKHRELMRTLGELRKMRQEDFGTEDGEEEKADGKCQMADGKCQMADDKCQMLDEPSEPTQEECGAPQNVQNEANLDLTQDSMPVEVESSKADLAAGKRSHSEAVARQDREADGTGIMAIRVEGRERHRSTTHAHSGEWMGDGEDRGDREASGPTPNGLGH